MIHEACGARPGRKMDTPVALSLESFKADSESGIHVCTGIGDAMNQLIASSRYGRFSHRVTRALVTALCCASLGSPALAQTAAPKRASGVSVQDQLDMDITPLPTG